MPFDTIVLAAAGLIGFVWGMIHGHATGLNKEVWEIMKGK